MKKTIKNLFITYLFSTCLISISSCAMSEPSQPEPVNKMTARTQEQNEIYLKHLNYEYRNRGRAFIVMEKMAKYSAGSDREAFFQAYYELEIINQKIFENMSKPLGVGYQANWFMRSGLNMFSYVGWRFVSPQQLIDIIIPYIPKLQEMESLANPEHKLFFAYIVAQEQAQLDASRAAKQESWDSGAKVLREFIEKQAKVFKASL